MKLTSDKTHLPHLILGAKNFLLSLFGTMEVFADY